MTEITLLHTFGYIGLALIIFSESGLLFGLLLPGDSLLFSAGFLVSVGYFQLVPLLILTFIASVTGYTLAYYLGKKYGIRIFKKDDSFFFDKSYIERSENFFDSHGGKTILLARFVPVVRTIAPILAGVGGMRRDSFLFYNLVGGLLWADGLIILGYFLGKKIPDIDTYILPIVLSVFVVSSMVPSFFYLYKRHVRRRLARFHIKS
ncbi:MAG: DedA family protein [Candidatus Paceibacterota bacterium]|jgi:membrane-associated protein